MGVVSFLSEFGNMSLVNGKWFLKYDWSIFKATQVRVYKLCIKQLTNNVMIYYHHIKITY